MDVIRVQHPHSTWLKKALVQLLRSNKKADLAELYVTLQLKLESPYVSATGLGCVQNSEDLC